MKNIKLFFTLLLIAITLVSCNNKHDVISLFPIENYDQNIKTWIKPTDPNYHQSLLSKADQQQRLFNYLKHYVGAYSPWSAYYVNKILLQPKSDDIKSIELSLLQLFSNKNKSANELGYAEDFRPYSQAWINDIAKNVHANQFRNLRYDPRHRAIAIENLHARALPTDDVFFFHRHIAGQGYPFDNLQMSALWVGTPVYVLGKTQDRAWSLVMTSDYIAWVKSSGLAYTDNKFIKTWQTAAIKNLIAITHTRTSIMDTNGIFRFSTYVGTVFPAKSSTSDKFKILIPVSDSKQHAVITTAFVSKKNSVLMPAKPTPENFSNIMQTLIGRPYGWGNLYFYNDCSAELKNLFTPFGFWLPRHSSDQLSVGEMTNLNEATTPERLHYLMQNGHPLFTIIYVGGHIILYIGNYPNPHSKTHELMPMTYQNMWGLSPKPANRRAVVGKSVVIPLLEHYPEDTSLASQASKKYFQISHLDEIPSHFTKLLIIDLKSLMYP